MYLFSSEPNRPGIFVACAAIIVIAVLAAGGPFFGMTRSAVPHPVHLKFLPGDEMVITSVGTLDPAAQTFTTKHTQGALVYGPYITLLPGHYAVSWTGTARAAGTARFEAFTTHTGAIASGNAPVAVSTETGLLQRIEFDVTETLPEVELRVLVGAADDLTIDGITLEVSAAARVSSHD
jgi:hypothetical protein